MATIDNPVRIAPGTSEDLREVMRVMEEAFGDRYGEAWTRSQCAGILPMAGVSLNLAFDGDNEAPVGFSLVRSVVDESELLLIAVIPSHQRRGIGRRLLDHFLEHAEAGGVRRVHLEVRDGNPAIAMYQAAGFGRVGRRKDYYHGRDGQQFDALTFARNL